MYIDAVNRIIMKSRRLSAILDLVEREPVRSQEQLRQQLALQGFAVTQATLSRDIKELGLMKRSADGAYQPMGAATDPQPLATATLAKALAEYLLGIETSVQLLVVRTGPGQAQLLALAIDRARLSPVAGTIAGDDTILVICRDESGAAEGRACLERLASEG